MKRRKAQSQVVDKSSIEKNNKNSKVKKDSTRKEIVVEGVQNSNRKCPHEHGCNKELFYNFCHILQITKTQKLNK